MTQLAWTDRVAAPLDRARRSMLSSLVRWGAPRALFASRDVRLASMAAAHAALAFTLTVLLPVPLLVLAPLVLGVPHVVSDLRYLVFRRTRRRDVRAAVVAACALLAGANAFALSGLHLDVTALEIALGTLAIAVAAIAGGRASDHAARSALLLAAALIAGGIALRRSNIAIVVLLHGHNVVALAAWLWLFRRRIRIMLAPLSLVACGTGVFLSGVTLPTTLRAGIWNAFGTNLLAAADWLAPGVRGVVGVGLASSFVFLQSVHYFVWLVAVPIDDRARAGATTFGRALRDFVGDMGPIAVSIVALACALVVGFGAAAPLVTRNVYLSLASFHVWLELAVLAFYAAAGRSALHTAQAKPLEAASARPGSGISVAQQCR